MTPLSATNLSDTEIASMIEELKPDSLWVHSNPKETQMWAFMQHANQKFGLGMQTWKELYEWSCGDVDLFWKECWRYLGVVCERGFDEVSRFSVIFLVP